MAPTAGTLPPELLLEVFAHLDDAAGEVDQQSLKHATLVCRAWADPAQSILWQAGATLDGDRDVERFVSTAPRRRVGPKEILVYGLRTVESLDKLWPSIAGVESLVIVSEGGVYSAKNFDHPALAGLKSLALKGSLIPSDPAIRLPFELTRLNISDTGIRTRHLASFLSTIVQSSTSTLRSVSLLSVSAPAHPQVAQAILPVAPNLRHVGLAIDPRDDATPYVAVFDAAKASLRSFECTSLPGALVAALPPSLRGFATMEDADAIDVAELGQALARLKGLERLYFACERKAFRDLPGGQELVAEVERRNVVWHFAEDY
ncbi:hypothetical protein JCM11491_007222 [Sporobolomyces phaffii]